ncbi:unnamed protein product, partial [Arabidopsis halleri]
MTCGGSYRCRWFLLLWNFQPFVIFPESILNVYTKPSLKHKRAKPIWPNICFYSFLSYYRNFLISYICPL